MNTTESAKNREKHEWGRMMELFGAAFVVAFVCAFVVVCAVMVGGWSDQHDD